MSTPYMTQLCERLFAKEAYNDVVCTNWFYQAFDHCSAILTKKPGSDELWNKIVKLKQFIFPEKLSSLVGKQIPISIHPDQLSPSNCQELANQVVKDYVYYIPRYMTVLNENQSLRLMLLGIFAAIAIVLCLVLVKSRYSTFLRSNGHTKPLPSAFKDWFLIKNIKRILYETKYLSVVPIVNPQLFQCGCPILCLKVEARRLLNICAILMGPLDKETPANGDSSQIQGFEKLKNFFNHTGQYRLIVTLNLDCGQEETPSKPTTPRSSCIPIHKSAKKTGLGIRRMQK